MLYTVLSGNSKDGYVVKDNKTKEKSKIDLDTLKNGVLKGLVSNAHIGPSGKLVVDLEKKEKSNGTKKLKCKVSGTDGNVFALMSTVSRFMKQNGLGDKIETMRTRVYAAKSYDDALNIMNEYVELV